MYIVVSLVINYLVYSDEVFDGKHMPSYYLFFFIIRKLEILNLCRIVEIKSRLHKYT